MSNFISATSINNVNLFFNSFHDDLNDSIVDNTQVTFKVLETGSKRGGRLLISTDGFSYVVKVIILSTTSKLLCTVPNNSLLFFQSRCTVVLLV